MHLYLEGVKQKDQMYAEEDHGSPVNSSNTAQ